MKSIKEKVQKKKYNGLIYNSLGEPMFKGQVKKSKPIKVNTKDWGKQTK